LEVLDEFNHLGITFISLRENIDTAGPLGRAMVVIVGAIAELERSLIVERVRAGMRPAKLEGRRIGRAPLDIDRQFYLIDKEEPNPWGYAQYYCGTGSNIYSPVRWAFFKAQANG
jgi:DNA invertase Pin-like site-specific DNA recombinase